MKNQNVNETEKNVIIFLSIMQNTKEPTWVDQLCNFQEWEKNRNSPTKNPEQIILRSLEWVHLAEDWPVRAIVR